MAEETKRLKKNDEVYIKSLGMHGKVLGGRDTIGEPEEDQFYIVQVIRYCLPSDLELIDREAELEKREAELQKKRDRLARALEQNDASEALAAIDDVWQTLGHEPLLRKK